jgi:hypothetical protein
MRGKYDNNPKSFLARIWLWHINFCPGWKGYMKSLDGDTKKLIIEKYNLPPGKFKRMPSRSNS